MYIGDLHIHSRYSRATSRDCTPEQLDLWARKKGIDIIGTGDFTHPAWREELKEKLEPAEQGLYRLKEACRIRDEKTPDDKSPRFVVTGEISSIYKKNGRVRKVHSLLLLPGLEEAERLARRLELIGNIHSDGRPILGLDCRDLLEIMLETCPDAVYVPAHIWTPHFSLFGAFSGFDSIEECFEDLTPHIHALETGLSSDPPMNWRVSALDKYQLISNSDAHSPAKLGREANLLDIGLSFEGLSKAIQTGKGLAGTLEFFPEEGKYHLDGHRKCGLCITPGEAAAYGNICPVCGKKLTIGVLHRVEELADREEGCSRENAVPFESLAPLPEVIAASTGASPTGKKVLAQYAKLLSDLGPEFAILREVPYEDIRRSAGPLVEEGIRRLRKGMVERSPGYDGEYGTIRLLTADDISTLEGQLSLFPPEEKRQGAGDECGNDKVEDSKAGTGKYNNGNEEKGEQKPRNEKSGELQEKKVNAALAASAEGGETKALQQEEISPNPMEHELAVMNSRQREAVTAAGRAVAVIAGPGAGKTRTLISRLMYLIKERRISPGKITAVTFTNKAAEEMRSRLEQLPQGKRILRQLQIGTFHSISSHLLTENGFPVSIADETLQKEAARKTIRQFGLKLTARAFLSGLSQSKSLEQNSGAALEGADPGQDSGYQDAYSYYQSLLREAGTMDYDDLLLETLRLCRKAEGSGGEAVSLQRFSWLLVDEFQDINPIQYQLLQAWNRDGKELFVIGDPDQSIYGFRGSDARCFERLGADFPELRTIVLEENYRSTPQILSGAMALITHNPGPERSMRAACADGRPIRVVAAEDERREAIYIAKEINRMVGGIEMLDTQEEQGCREKEVRCFSDIAVLYRTHRQAKLLEYCFKREGIPYVLAGREDFLEEPQIRGALYFFRQVLHPEDEAARRLALRLLWETEDETAGEKLGLLAEKYRKASSRTKPAKLLEEWAADMKQQDEEAMRKLTNMAVLHSNMEEFLQTLTFGEDGDIRRNEGRRFASDSVTLMTFHGSKGLEFPAVFLYGARKGLTPLETGKEAPDLQEERRLFYVAMTRAREELILTTSGGESCFIGELPAGVCEREETTQKQAVEVTQLCLFDFMA